MDDTYKSAEFRKEAIVYPVYETTNRYKNLYEDVRTWLRELIQNADDAMAKSLTVELLLPDKIIVKNDGNIFNDDDIQRLLTPSKGGKSFTKTGALNVGALSVLSISDEPIYHSGNLVIRFSLDHDREEFSPYVAKNFPSHFEGTKLTLPLHNRISKNDFAKLENIENYISKNDHLIFSRNLREILLKYPEKSVTILKKHFATDKFISLGREVEVEHVKTITKETINRTKNKKISNWIIFTTSVTVPKRLLKKMELREIKKLDLHYKIPVSLGFKIKSGYIQRLNYPLYITFPSTTPMGYGFVLSSNFKPDTSRRGFASDGIEGEFNVLLIKKAAKLLEIVLYYFKSQIERKPRDEQLKFFKSMLISLYFLESYHPLIEYFKNGFDSSINSFLKRNILTKSRKWEKATNVVICRPELEKLLKKKKGIIYPLNDKKIEELLLDVGVKLFSTDRLINSLLKNENYKYGEILEIWEGLFANKVELNKKRVVSYLFDLIIERYPGSVSLSELKQLIAILDKTYSYLGTDKVFNNLSFKDKNRLCEKDVIYIPSIRSFKPASKSLIYSKESAQLFDKFRFYIKTEDFPNSINFFFKIGVKSSASTNDIAEFLIEYSKEKSIDTQKLFSLYQILGDRFQYLNKQSILLLNNSKVILHENLKEFFTPRNIYLSDDDLIDELFGDIIPKALVNRYSLRFLEKLDIMKVSEMIEKKIKYSGPISEDNNTRKLTHKLRELVPFIEIIIDEGNLHINPQWKRRFYKLLVVKCDEIYHQLEYKGRFKTVKGYLAEYDVINNRIIIKSNDYHKNSGEFQSQLAKALATVIFLEKRMYIKLYSPLIEKLLIANNKTSLLKSLGFSTLQLKAKGMNNIGTTIINNDVFIQPNKILRFNKDIKNYFTVDKNTTAILNAQNPPKFKIIEFSKFKLKNYCDIKPSLPRLVLKKVGWFAYYEEEDFNKSYSIDELKKFSSMMTKILQIMQAKSVLISVILSNSPIHAFNVKGHLFFNYVLLVQSEYKSKIPLYFFWILIAAHELAHVFSKEHNNLHYNTMMKFAIIALEQLDKIKKKYQKLYRN